MFGFGRSTYKRVEDVVVEDAEDLRIDDGAIGGSITVSDPQDVAIED